MKVVLRTFWVLLVLCVAAGITFYTNPLWVNDELLRLKLWRAGVNGHSIQVDGYRLHYLEAAPADGSAGVPLLLLHGLGSRGEDWARLIPLLAAQGFHVYAPDLLGYGRSQKPDVDYSIALEEKTVVAFMDAVHLSHADVGGWSMGGWVAMKLAAEHPERVDRLVLYDSAGVYFAGAEDVAELFVPHNLAGLSRLMAMLSPRPAKLPVFAQRAALRRIQGNSWVVLRAVASMQAAGDLMEFRLSEIHQPTLMVWGGADALIPLSAGEKMHAGIPGSVLDVVQGCGHLAPAECTAPVLQATLGFLKAEPPPRGGETLYPEPAQP
ncbi:MAG: alpha/beta fold hydrolase [Acidobacteriota bacterium]|nr:alpha/beta fold hydrolase [Acidobacteriota bacterium]